MVLMNKCCCCNLRTGAIILGWLGLASDVFNLISLIVSNSQISKSAPEGMSEEEFETVMSSVSSSMIGSFVIGIIADVALLWGAYRKHHLMLLPWLITCGIKIVVLIIVVIFGGIFAIIKGITTFAIMIFIVGIPIAALQAYFWFAVLSLYQRFREDEALNNRRRQEEVGFIVQEPSAPNYMTKPPPYKVATQEC